MTSVEAAASLARWRPAGITTFSELCLETTGELADHCGLDFHSTNTIELLTDKLAQREALARAGVDRTRAVAVTSPADAGPALAAVGLPAIVKPRRGFGSRGVVLVQSVDACSSAIADLSSQSLQLGPLMVEEYLDGNETSSGWPWSNSVSVESLVHNGVNETVTVTGRCRLAPPFREQGMFLPAPTDPQATREIIDLAGSAVAALGVRSGITHVELQLTSRGPRVVEVHGRLGGYVAVLLRRSGGVDIIAAGFRLALGVCPEVPSHLPKHVVFQYFLVPPLEAVEVSEIHGGAELRGLSGVEAVDIRAHPRQYLDWRHGTSSQLGTVFGKASDHEAFAALIEQIEETFVPQYVCSTENTVTW